MPPKKPFKLPKLPKKAAKQEPILTSAQDFLDQGVEEEESGDRWLQSDLSKALRFYQKAYDHYLTGIEKDSRLLDSYYNANRLLFHVYETYHSINAEADLKNIEECYPIISPSITDIKRNHEMVIKKFIEIGEEKLINWEFYYNLLLIDTEVLEISVNLQLDDIEGLLNDSTGIINRVIDFQLGELDTFVRRLENPTTSTQDQTQSAINEEGNESNQEEVYDVIVQVTPSVLFETLLSGLKLIRAAYESVDNQIQLNYLQNQTSQIISRIYKTSDLLLTKFNPVNENPFNINLEPNDVEEFTLIKYYIEGLFIKDFKKLQTHWNSLEIFSLSKYLIEADSIESLKNNEPSFNSEQIWEIINFINQLLKRAQDLAKDELQENINNKTNKVSEKVSKSIEILINRADNELTRSFLSGLEVSVKNRDILRQNAINLLKNGLNLSNTNVGLRESAGDRLKREKLRRECTVRLVVITKDPLTEDDFVRNLGLSHYKQEVKELQTIDVYLQFFN